MKLFFYLYFVNVFSTMTRGLKTGHAGRLNSLTQSKNGGSSYMFKPVSLHEPNLPSSLARQALTRANLHNLQPILHVLVLFSFFIQPPPTTQIDTTWPMLPH